jgi:S-adenosylmethionine hydrolase
MIYNYYIDKRKNNKSDDFIDIHLEHPIETTNYEYLKVKLCDFKFLNNIFNISGNLMNNKFNIRRYSKTYTITGYTGELYLTDEGFFDDQNALLVNEVIDITQHKSTITYDNTILTYYNTSLITDDTQSYWVNILSDTIDTNRKMELQDSYVNIFEITSQNEPIYSFDITFYKDQNVSGSTTDVDIVLQKFNINSGVWNIVETQTLTFQNAGSQQISQTFTTISPVSNEKYRITSYTGSLPFALYIVKLQADKQIPLFDNGTINSPVEHTITIPDGFYKSSNFKTTLNDLLSSYKLTTSIDQYTNKLKITNDNPTFTPTIDDLIDDNYQLDLVIPNIQNMLENWGITNSYQTYIPVPFNSYYEGDTHINLINLSKIIITTDLNFQNKTHNEIIKGNEIHRGFGNILTWIDTDDAPYTCIKYRNYEDLTYRIENKHITTIRLRFYNEKSQPLILDNALLHLQIIKYQKKSFY